MRNEKILILGKIPPPSGGVTIHVGRLLERLDSISRPCEFYSLSNPVGRILRKSLKYKHIHLHTSHVYFRFLFAAFCLLFNKRLIQTYHNNLGRFGRFKNLFEYASIRITSIPVVINRESYRKALRLNSSSRLISSFIAPVEQAPLPAHLLEKAEGWRKAYPMVFCTNASCLKYDIYGQEVYGGSMLFEIFSKHSHLGLIFSDPSGEYTRFLEEKYQHIPGNIHLINEEHGFLEIIKMSDCFIRSSTTDGDSLSVKEALWLDRSVIASDCVDRPDGCMLYPVSEPSALEEQIVKFSGEGPSFVKDLDGFVDILNLYKNMLGK